MKSRAFINLLCIAILLLAGETLLLAQQRGRLHQEQLEVDTQSVPQERPEQITPNKPRSALRCDQIMGQLYDDISHYLYSTETPSLEGIKRVGTSVLGAQTQDLIALKLTEGRTPDFFVGYSCNVDVTNMYGTFRVFKATNGTYITAANSEGNSLLTATDSEGTRNDSATLEASLLTSLNSERAGNYIATVWTRGGGRPAPFSIIVWEWNGQTLQPVWSKLEIRGGTVKVAGPLIVLSTTLKLSQTKELSATEVYRLDGEAIRLDGTLNKGLMQRYTDEGLFPAQQAEDFINLAYLWQSVGETEHAIQAYEKAITLDTKAERGYLYLTVVNLYEERGEFGKAAKTLQTYSRSTKAQLSPQSKRELEQRIEQLRSQEVTNEP